METVRTTEAAGREQMSGNSSGVKPAVYISTLYFIEGLPYAMVNMMSVVMFKNLLAPNELIALVTSNLAWPWMLKPLWAPFIDLVGTRRSWVLVAHLVLAGLSVLLAFASLSANAIPICAVLFAITAFVSATQDIAMDGFYMDALDQKDQAFYVGFRNAAYKIAWLTGQGALVVLVGLIADKYGQGFHVGWCASFAVCAVLFLAAAAFHSFALPKPRKLHSEAEKENSPTHQVTTQFRQVFETFFTQYGIVAIVMYILLFRLGDALMLKMTVPFILDKPAAGGLGIDTMTEGVLYGTVGMVALLVGGILGSALISRLGLKRCLMPAAILQSAAIPLYWALSVYRPNVPMVACVNAFEQFAYGIGATAYTIYLLSTVKPEYRASHYAIATGMMALGLQVPGMVSGYLTKLGYPTFFLISFAASIPGILIIPFLPFKDTPPEGSSEAPVQVEPAGH